MAAVCTDRMIIIAEHISMCAAAATMMQVKTELKEHETKEGKNALQQVDSCWALGDCCANMENALPALAQV